MISFARCTWIILVLGYASHAGAMCRIYNDTKWDFVVASGNTSNQSVGAHTHTSIAEGKIIGKSKDGKAISGVCKSGESLKVSDERGIPVLVTK